MKYFVFHDEKVLSYADGYLWVPVETPNHHRLASEFVSNRTEGSAEFLAEFGGFMAGACPGIEQATITLAKAEKYFADQEALMTSAWALVQGMIRSGAKRILLYGPPGVGKSYTPWKEAQGMNAHFHSVTLTDMTPMAELRGHFIIKGMDTVWHDGILMRAWRDSKAGKCICVLNEIDHVGADAESFLHNFLDDEEMARVYLPTGEELTPGDIQVVATMNGHPDDLADALKDRFTVKVEISEPHPDALKSLPASLQEFARRMICDPPKGQERLSLRAFMDFVKLTKDADPSKGGVTQAARAMFAERGDDVVQALKVATSK